MTTVKLYYKTVALVTVIARHVHNICHEISIRYQVFTCSNWKILENRTENEKVRQILSKRSHFWLKPKLDNISCIN